MFKVTKYNIVITLIFLLGIFSNLFVPLNHATSILSVIKDKKQDKAINKIDYLNVKSDEKDINNNKNIKINTILINNNINNQAINDNILLKSSQNDNSAKEHISLFRNQPTLRNNNNLKYQVKQSIQDNIIKLYNQENNNHITKSKNDISNNSNKKFKNIE